MIYYFFFWIFDNIIKVSKFRFACFTYFFTQFNVNKELKCFVQTGLLMQISLIVSFVDHLCNRITTLNKIKSGFSITFSVSNLPSCQTSLGRLTKRQPLMHYFTVGSLI